MGARVIDTSSNGRIRPRTTCVEHAHSHKLNFPAHTDGRIAIVRRGPDRSCDMCSMASQVIGITVVVDKIRTDHVVDKSVVIVVRTIACNLARVVPHLRSQITVRITNTAIDHSDNNVGRTCGNVPGFNRINVNSRSAPLLAGILQTP